MKSSDISTFDIARLKRIRKALAPEIAKPDCGWKQYCEYIYRDDQNKRIKFAAHQQVIFDFIDLCFSRYCSRVAIEAPWGHGKTQSLGVFYPSRKIGLNKNIRIKLSSKNTPIATLRVGANKNIIDLNDDYRLVFPHIKPGKKWGESAFKVDGAAISGTDYTMQGGGVNSSIIGGRADLLIFDDPCDMENSATEDQRKKTVEKIRGMWMSRLAPDGKILWIGTPWHREDAMAQITARWQRLKICVSEDISCLEVWQNGEFKRKLPLWEDVWSFDRLKQEREENYRTFNIGYRLIPATDEESTFKHLEKSILWETNPWDYEFQGLWAGVDLSTKTRKGTVAVIGGVTTNRLVVVCDVIYLDDPVKLRQLFMQWANEFGGRFNFANVENNATQDVIVDMLKSEHIIAIRPFTTGRNKADPLLGLPALDADFESSRMVIPVPHKRDDSCNCGRCKLIRALRLHPFGSETDSVMACWFFRGAIKLANRVPFV